MASSLSSAFPAVNFVNWARATTTVPPEEYPRPPTDAEAVHQQLRRLGFDTFHNEPVRYPRSPPTPDEWRAHLDKLEADHVWLEERSFDQDSADLVEAESEAEQCANGEACVAYSCAHIIAGLERRGGIVLRRLQPPHAPMCVLCHRNLLVTLTIRDRSNRSLLNQASELAQPGPEPYVLKQLRSLQSFYNLVDMPGEYASAYVFTGSENDLVTLPIARTNLSCLFATVIPGTQRYRILQDAMRYLHDPDTAVKPGETVQQLKQRTKKRLEQAHSNAAEKEHLAKTVLNRRHLLANALASRPVIVTADVVPAYMRAAPDELWVDLQSLDEQMASGIADNHWALAVTEMFDAALHLDRATTPRFVQVASLRSASVASASLLSQSLHVHIEDAAYFSPLSTVKDTILQVVSKSVVRMRCQSRNSYAMAMKRLVTRSLEQVGRAKKKVSVTNVYDGYVLTCCKAWMLTSLLGNYTHVDHGHRIRDAATRRRLYEVFTDARHERWVVNLMHQSIEVMTVCIREFTAWSIERNPALAANVAGAEMMRLEEYTAMTQRAVNQLRAYFGEHLTNPGSEVARSFAPLPAKPCSLQRYFQCGKPDCRLPCPHKFMKANELKSVPSVADDDVDQDLTASLIEEMSSDRPVVVHHRREEVDRERQDDRDEKLSGWRWREEPWHKELNAMMAKMESDAASLSYSRPWKVDVLFGTGKGAAALPAEDDQLLAEVVRGCGPVRCGEPLPRIVPFFSLMGVRPDVVGAVVDLVSPRLRLEETENNLRRYAALLREREPRAAALLRRSWELVSGCEDHFVLQNLPPNVARWQCEAVRDVYLGKIVCDHNVCFVFCPRCDTLYSHLVDDTTAYRKSFRFGLNRAATERLTHHVYCTAKSKHGGGVVCDERLVFLNLVGRVLWWKKHRLTVAMCCQPRCARLMVLDRSAPDLMWTTHGWSCHRCMMAGRLASARRFEDVEFVFSADSGAPQQCALWQNHERQLERKPNMRFPDAQLHILAPGVYCCQRCYLPAMAERAKRGGGDLVSMMRDVAAASEAEDDEERQTKRRRRLIAAAAKRR